MIAPEPGPDWQALSDELTCRIHDKRDAAKILRREADERRRLADVKDAEADQLRADLNELNTRRGAIWPTVGTDRMPEALR